MTGFLTCTRGSSFLNDAGMATRIILGSQIEMAPLRRVFHCLTSNSSGWVSISVCILEHLPCLHQQLFNDWPQRVGREKGERAYDQDHTDQQANEERGGRGERSQPGRHDPLLDERAS